MPTIKMISSTGLATLTITYPNTLIKCYTRAKIIEREKERWNNSWKQSGYGELMTEQEFENKEI